MRNNILPLVLDDVAESNGHTFVRIAFPQLSFDDEIVSEAFAIAHPDDKADKNIGFDIAMGRALQKLGKKLEKRAEGLAKHVSDNADRVHKVEKKLIDGTCYSSYINQSSSAYLDEKSIARYVLRGDLVKCGCSLWDKDHYMTPRGARKDNSFVW